MHPVTIAISIALGILAAYFMYRGYKKNKGKGGLQRNLTTTFLVISAFMFGYLFAAYQTHDYFESRTHHDHEECETCSIEESKEQVLLMDDNIDPIILNPINRVDEMSKSIKDAIEMNNVKEAMKAELMKQATVKDEVMCECPYHEQLEKGKAEDANMNVK